jgi:hypothetical protein
METINGNLSETGANRFESLQELSSVLKFVKKSIFKQYYHLFIITFYVWFPAHYTLSFGESGFSQFTKIVKFRGKSFLGDDKSTE